MDDSVFDLDNALDNEKQCYLILKKISDLYDKVFTPYHRGEKIIYNPNIFTHLTKDIFIDWVISSNTRLSQLFHQQQELITTNPIKPIVNLI